MEPNTADPVYRQIFDGTAGYRSIWWQQDFWANAIRNRVAVFQVQGLNDDLFPLPEAKRMLLALQSLDPLYPIASYFGDLGHPRSTNKAGERDGNAMGLARQWFDVLPERRRHGARARGARGHYAPARPSVQSCRCDHRAELRCARDQYRGERFQRLAILVNPLADPYAGFFWDPLVMEASHELTPLAPPPEPPLVGRSLGVYTVPVAELSGRQPLLIAGQPTVSLRATTFAPRVQLDVRLIDAAPDGSRELITRGTLIVEGPDLTADIAIPTYGNAWEAAPDHVLRLEITNIDSPYLTPSRVPSVTLISRVQLTLPVR